jgi:hypothetical protein
VRRKKAGRVWNPDPGIVTVVRVLLLLQGAFALLTTIEVLFLGLVTGTLAVLAPVVGLTLTTAVVVLALVAALGRGSTFARRLIVIGEVVVVLVAAVDLGLAVFLAKAPLDLVPFLTRVALPVAVIAFLRRSKALTTEEPSSELAAPLAAV